MIAKITQIRRLEQITEDLLQHKTYKEIAKRFKISRQRIGQISARLRKKGVKIENRKTSYCNYEKVIQNLKGRGILNQDNYSDPETKGKEK